MCLYKEALHIPQGLTQNFNVHPPEPTAVVLVCFEHMEP